jgi:tripartite-type tricarboxylate transporter receptor subunit TctC
MTVLRTLLALVLVASLASALRASAQDYPARTVRLIVPYSPGGLTDVYSRLLAQGLGESLKQAFVIENRPGAGSVVGTDLAAKAAPDGYTLLLMSSTHTVNESLVHNKSYQLMCDFVAVAPVISSDLVMVVPPSLPVNSAKEFIALAKSKPGTLNFASSGQGSNYHMAAELLKASTGIDIVHVAYRGSAGARRHSRRSSADDVRLGSNHGALRLGRTGKGVGDNRQGTLAHSSECADDGGSRCARL